MVNLDTARLAGITIGLGLVAIAGTNFAFAQQQPCVENQAYTYIGCTPMSTAQLYGAITVAGVIAFSVAVAAASGPRLHRAWT